MASFPSAHSPAKWKFWHSHSTAFEPQIPEAHRRCFVFSSEVLSVFSGIVFSGLCS